MNLTLVSKSTGRPFFSLPRLFWAGDHSWITNDKSGFISCHFDLGFKRERFFHCACTKATYTHTHTCRGQECDVLISSWLGRRFVCQLNNGLAGIKASHCHNYTPAGINPVYINVIIVRRVHTPERCISIRSDLLHLPWIVSLKLFVTPSQAHKDAHIWSRKKWNHSFLFLTLEQLRCKHCDQQSRRMLKLFW